jgi:hypothetical protein
MFLLNGSRLAEGTPFIANGIQYPANWLNLTTLAEKEAIGITEVNDPVRADDRFYWDGNLDNPKALEDVTETVDEIEHTTKGLKSNFIAQVKHTAGTILAQTDWMVIRKAERNVNIPASVVAYRAAVVAKADELEAAIAAVTTVGQLAALNLSFPSED